MIEHKGNQAVCNAAAACSAALKAASSLEVGTVLSAIHLHVATVGPALGLPPHKQEWTASAHVPASTKQRSGSAIASHTHVTGFGVRVKMEEWFLLMHMQVSATNSTNTPCIQEPAVLVAILEL